MKKIFKFMMMALAAVVLAVGFAACSSDDDDNDGPTPENPTMKESYMKLKLTFSEDYLSVFDVTLSYTDIDGSTKTETITTKEYSKNVTYTKTPSTMSCQVKVNKKKVDYSAKDSYDFTYSYDVVLAKEGVLSSIAQNVSAPKNSSTIVDFVNRCDGKNIYSISK